MLLMTEIVFDLSSKPEGDYGSLPRGMRKSDSQFSLDWDAALEKARQEALAPDHVPLVSSPLIGYKLFLHTWLLIGCLF